MQNQESIKKLRAKHAELMKADNSLMQDKAIAIRKEIIALMNIPVVMQSEHCQSCGSATRRTCQNEGYSECCNELIVSGGCDANHCFHLV